MVSTVIMTLVLFSPDWSGLMFDAKYDERTLSRDVETPLFDRRFF